MNKDRLIQAIAVGTSAAALLGASALSPVLQQRRVTDQLVSQVEINEAVPPGVALAATALGSFRGLAANVLWYRLEMLKRDGEFHEADTLSRMITTLQPRFPQVWVFMGWNMAYNISVETHTPQERWDWVNKGIRLLREEAIPLNPNSIRLYRELGWFHFHKVGERTDDMHKYYKYKFADEWDQVLGPLYEGRSDEEIFNGFAPISSMSERYWGANRPNYTNRRLLRVALDVAPDDVELKKIVYGVEEAPLDQLMPEIDRLEAQLRKNAVAISENQKYSGFSIDKYMDQVRVSLNDRIKTSRGRKIGITGFLQDFSGQPLGDMSVEDRDFFADFAVEGSLPDMQLILDRLEAGGIKLDRAGLLRIGKIIGTVVRLMPVQGQQFSYWKLPDTQKLEILQQFGLTKQDISAYDTLMGIQFNHISDDGQIDQLGAGENLFEPFTRVLLPYWRAKVLNEQYRMDPTTMHLLMSEYGPIDWRNPAAHSIYWGQAGLQRTMQLLDANRIDVVNTQRGIIHGIQSLERYGRVVLNPYAQNPNDRVSYQPNFAFADTYEKAMFVSKEIYETLSGAKGGASDTFDTGHKNFLIDVANRAFVFGDEARAERYYIRARTLYGTDDEGNVNPRFAKPLADFVFEELDDDLLVRYDVARNAIVLMIQRAFKEGIAVGDLDHFDALTRQARQWYNKYQESKEKTYRATADTARLALEPWPEFVGNAFVALVTNPAESPVMRNRVIINSDPDLLKLVATRLIDPLTQEFGGDWRWLSAGVQQKTTGTELDSGLRRRE